jgi:hypothetical protein
MRWKIRPSGHDPRNRSFGRARHRHRSDHGWSLLDRASEATADERLHRAEPIRALVTVAASSFLRSTEPEAVNP